MQDELFEWDDDKADVNEAKHKVTFDYAAELLQGDWVGFKARVSGEPRTLALARDGGQYFVVIFTMRAGRYRIISARHATKREAATYERYSN